MRVVGSPKFRDFGYSGLAGGGIANILVLDEIARLPLDVALDLGLYPGDADRIAHRAVYGH